MKAWQRLVLAALLVLTGCGSNNDDAEVTSLPAAEQIGVGGTVEMVAQWGRAWESGDTDAVLALYSSDVDERHIVDQTFRAVWRDVEAAIEQINSTNDFERFELLRAEDFGIAMVAEYEVEWAPEDGSPADRHNIVVVFNLDPDGIVGSDIYVPAWVNLFGIDYAPDEDGAWVNVD